ncbi:asparagine synthase (glutamine-hydrolyzing) [Micromonospora echinofusca]|uniref:asparagine synthase (glutamine-hydrolyzing) n=1 Tax=Micromonospora echinofusca TaxID=47858 RepID=A0A1C5G7E8_MICEH|nr:asparagine synthase (glutamine-hydrolyzing) [Micromonospora echinofusca]SCG15789.1 asparagine synthase (glutamine-hydrolysing) [Micromonospora echinofusca]
MSGITGWVDFDRHPTGEPTVTDAMIAALVDGGGGADRWAAGPALFGAVRPGPHGGPTASGAAGGGIHSVSEAGTPLATVVFAGTLHNGAELRAELGHGFTGPDDAETVLRAYLRWGEGCVDRLNGMYAFAVWDVREQELLLVRDRMGVEPLYYFDLPSGVLFGSLPKAVFAHPRVPRRVDADGFREIVSVVKTPGHAIVAGLRELPPGHLLRLRRDGRSQRCYWRVPAHQHPDDLPTTIRTVRELLDDIVERQLRADTEVCSLLSGGLDSSTISVLAARTRAAQGRAAFRTYSVDFVGYAEHFQASHMRTTPDAPFVAEVVRHARTTHEAIVLDSAELMDPGLRGAVLRAMDLPTGMGDLSASLYLLFGAVRQRQAVVLSGESADELFGGYSWYHDPAAVAADTFPWLPRTPPEQGSGGGVFDPAFFAWLDVPGYQKRRYREALDEVPTLPGEPDQDRRMRELTYLNLTRFSPMMLDRKDRMSRAAGLEVRLPFCDHRLIEYVVNVPWAMKSFDGFEKSLLRAAVEDVLPPGVRQRRKSHFPRTQDPAYLAALRAEFAALTARPEEPVVRLLNADTVRRMVAADAPADSRATMEGLIELNHWLTSYDITLDV